MKLLRPGELASVLPRDGLALVSSCSAESDLLADEVEAAQPGSMEFAGIFVPGLNRRTWSGSQARVTTFFQTPQLAREGDRARFLPLCYADILAFLRRSKPTAAVFMCAPPDDFGYCSFGTEVAHIAALWEEIPVRIAHINPLMPRTPGDPGIPAYEITAAYDAPQPLRTMTVGEPDESALAIARHVASQVPNGATLQTGLGKVPDAVLHALTGHRELRLHTGLIGDGALALVEVAKRRGRKVTEVAITFRRKAPIAVVAAEEENERHRAGRRARREGTVETVVDPAAIIAATAASLSVSDILRWPADDQVSEYRTPDLYAIGLANGGGHAIQRLADQYVRVRSDRRRQLRGDALRDDWTTWVKGCAEKWAKP